MLAVEIAAPPALGRRTYARPFALRLPSGAAIRVEPAEGQWSLDTTFVPVPRDGRTVYGAVVATGDVVYVAGQVGREIDPGIAGTGYRDVARSWVIRGELAFSSAGVVAAHAGRARFHGRWAAGLAALLMAAQANAAGPASTSGVGTHGSGDGVALVVVLLGMLGVLYWAHAEATAPWVKRAVTIR